MKVVRRDLIGDIQAEFYTDEVLSEGHMSLTTYERFPTAVLYEDLYRVKGVQALSIDRYKIFVERSLAVPWEEIEDEIRRILEKERT